MAVAPVIHRTEAVRAAIEQNPGVADYLLTDLWMRRAGVTIFLPEDQARWFAVTEDPPVLNGGRHEYSFKTLVCDRHVSIFRRDVLIRGGCGRRSPFALEREDKRRERLRQFGVQVMGMALESIYLFEHEGEDWLPLSYPEAFQLAGHYLNANHPRQPFLGILGD